MNNLRKIRRARDITQKQLALSIGAGISYVCDLERGHVKQPSLDRARSIANALDSNIDDIFPPRKINKLSKFLGRG